MDGFAEWWLARSGSLKDRKSITYVLEGKYWAIAQQVFNESYFVGPSLWLINSRYYLPNLMSVKSQNMKIDDVDSLITCWLLTHEDKYIIKCSNALGENANPEVAKFCLDLFRKFRDKYPLFAKAIAHIHFPCPI